MRKKEQFFELILRLLNLNIDTCTRTDTRKTFIINENLLYSSRNSHDTIIFIFNVHILRVYYIIIAICAKNDDN